jgi:hypothetical protein
MSTNSNNSDKDYTLAVIRRLTRPLIDAPHRDDLAEVLMDPWPIRVAVSPTDYATLHHWKGQSHTPLFRSMFEWPGDESTASTEDHAIRPTAHLHPFFSFGDPSSPFFFNPWQDIGNCLRNLLLHQIASHQTLGHDITLSTHELDIFIATGNNFAESEVSNLRLSPQHYLLRCHHDHERHELQVGYHCYCPPKLTKSESDDTATNSTFHKLHIVSLRDENWRLTTCIILKNIARILVCMKDFAIPLVARPDKLSIVTITEPTNDTQTSSRVLFNPVQQRIQKVYENEFICNIFSATVSNMIRVYQTMKDAHVPHTDQIVAIVEDSGSFEDAVEKRRIIQFAPIGRSYLPENFEDLLDALICVAKTLVSLGKLGIMHRDIRWANVFHALNDSSSANEEHSFTKEWVLFDFEYAAFAPQMAFPAHTLTLGNHAPEMIRKGEEENDCRNATLEPHDLAVDIWGLGFLIQHAEVDIPESHAADIAEMKCLCLLANPKDRPSAQSCLQRLEALRGKPSSVSFEAYLRQSCVKDHL